MDDGYDENWSYEPARHAYHMLQCHVSSLLVNEESCSPFNCISACETDSQPKFFLGGAPAHVGLYSPFARPPRHSRSIERSNFSQCCTVIHVSMDQSNLDFLGKLFVAENETFLVGSILAILINYVVRNLKHYRTLLKGAMKAISANCCYQWERTSHIG
jgi:hypothetical protein